jgi:hypothetical protein
MGERHSFGRKGVCLKCGAKNTSAAGTGPCELWRPPCRKPAPRPTVLTMGEETVMTHGPAEDGGVSECGGFLDPRSDEPWLVSDWCPAPTPRAKS